MRNLPIALVSSGNSERLIRDSFLNSITTHGHPRAIFASILMGAAIQFALHAENDREGMLHHLRETVGSVGGAIKGDRRIGNWIEAWEKSGKLQKGGFGEAATAVVREIYTYLDDIPSYRDRPASEYYRRVGALASETRGSGVATACAGIFLFLKNELDPAQSIYAAVNELGSDTDTIAGFAGSLIGARYGMRGLPTDLVNGIQDRGYLLKIAQHLHAIAAMETGHQAPDTTPLAKEEAFLRILAWEMGLYEMFWDAIDAGGSVVHPTLGRGRIISKDVRTLQREGYAAKLIHISFDCGQTCVFHSRVKDEEVAESLASDVEKALYGRSAGR